MSRLGTVRYGRVEVSWGMDWLRCRQVRYGRVLYGIGEVWYHTVAVRCGAMQLWYSYVLPCIGPVMFCGGIVLYC